MTTLLLTCKLTHKVGVNPSQGFLGEHRGFVMKDFKNRRHAIFFGEPRTTLFNRLNAKAIDLVIVAALYFLGKTISPALGIIGATVFCALQDGFGVGQSIGKRIIGLRVIENGTGLSCSLRNSALRNLPFVFGILFTSTPLLWILLIMMTIPSVGLELYLLLTLDSGMRVGDVLGNTQVIEYVDEVFPEFSS